MNGTNLHDRLGEHILTSGMDEIELDLQGSVTPYVRDARTGEDWLDFGSFYASSALGMNHPALRNDHEFLDRLLRTAVNKPANSDFVSREFVEFVETFARVLGDPDLPHYFFIEGGSAAVENALKVAFDWKQKRNRDLGLSADLGTQVLHLEHAFHGRGGYTLSLTNTDPVKVSGFPKFGWPRITAPAQTHPLSPEAALELDRAEESAVENARSFFLAHPGDIACFIAEPVQGEGGDRHLRPRFLQAMQELCREFDALFILDEVQTGCGLTGSTWAYRQLGLEPDIVVFGKKVQVCGLMAGRRVDLVGDNVFRVPSRINSTWGGNLTDMVRARRILEVVETEDLVTNAATVGERLLTGLRDLALEFPQLVRNPRGRGLMCALSLPSLELRNEVLAGLAAQRILVLGCGENSIRFRPPLCIDAAAVDSALTALRSVLSGLQPDRRA
jgi:L-lysine 6-transaminase